MAKPGQELAKSHKPASDMKVKAPRVDHLGRMYNYAEPSGTAKKSDALQYSQNGSTSTKLKLHDSPDMSQTSQSSPRREDPCMGTPLDSHIYQGNELGS